MRRVTVGAHVFYTDNKATDIEVSKPYSWRDNTFVKLISAGVQTSADKEEFSLCHWTAKQLEKINYTEV
ncbi:hypothetical protein MHH70_15100 [Metasolibacillus sp. FSL H7-0170]|uniref:hypothetical protein n=1 Tax=Metasolibacillus TaxID=2703677 RepID=UPI000D377D0E|nr:hypothetical protein [Metasolibacillus fluoroglycofenilyticus]